MMFYFLFKNKKLKIGNINSSIFNINTIGNINPNIFNPHFLHDTEARHILFWPRIKTGRYVEEDKV